MTTKSYIAQSVRAKAREEEPFLVLEISKCLEWLNHTIRARAKKQTQSKKETLILTPMSMKLSLLIMRVKTRSRGLSTHMGLKGLFITLRVIEDASTAEGRNTGMRALAFLFCPL